MLANQPSRNSTKGSPVLDFMLRMYGQVAFTKIFPLVFSMTSINGLLNLVIVSMRLKSY